MALLIFYDINLKIYINLIEQYFINIIKNFQERTVAILVSRLQVVNTMEDSR